LLKFLNKKYSSNINNYNNNSNNGSNYKSPKYESPNNDSDNKDDKLITIKIGKSFEKLYSLNNLLSKPVVVFYNALLYRNDIIKNYKNVSGIYFLHNSVNGKQYIGSGYNLSRRLSTYYYPSRLIHKRHISNSILWS
jgi:hypothetical protein